MVEYFPTAILATSYGVGYSMSRVASAIGLWLSVNLNIVSGNTITAVVSAVSAILAYLLSEDTTGKVMTNYVNRGGSNTSDLPLLASVMEEN